MMIEILIDVLKNNGFHVEYFFQDEQFFGNMIVRASIQNEKLFSIVCDRGDWECTIETQKGIIRKSIPIVAAIRILRNQQIDIAETIFQSAEEMLSFLTTNQEILAHLNNKDISKIQHAWNRAQVNKQKW